MPRRNGLPGRSGPLQVQVQELQGAVHQSGSGVPGVPQEVYVQGVKSSLRQGCRAVGSVVVIWSCLSFDTCFYFSFVVLPVLLCISGMEKKLVCKQFHRNYERESSFFFFNILIPLFIKKNLTKQKYSP